MASKAPEFFSDDFSHARHRKAVAAMIVAVLVFGVLLIVYIIQSESTSPIPPRAIVDEATIRRSLLSQSNPPVAISSAELGVRQALLSSSNTPSKLSAEELEMRKKLLTQ